MRTRLLSLLLLFASVSITTTASAVSFDWVTVGDPGNAADPATGLACQTGGCFGAVSETYRISKYEVTNTQYVEFLNAADPDGTNPNGIYNSYMTADSAGGIDFNGGAAAGAKYSPKAGRGAMPVIYVSWYDSLRFVNWLHNGQGSGSTETGAYTFSDATSVGPREPTALFFLPTEDEWYKAAYFDGTSYFDYPAGTDTQTGCAAPGATANTANCGNVVGDLTDVGSYTGAASPYGTFDQGGNVLEWNETRIGPNRGTRGGAAGFSPVFLAASIRLSTLATTEDFIVGFRVASPIPEPGTGLLLATGLAGLALRRAL